MTDINKDGIPIGTKLHAEVKIDEKEIPVVISAYKKHYKLINVNNSPLIEGKEFNSLSAAAEFFSRVKRINGWTYWKLMSGKTAREEFRG
jgi:hypothetical protein